MKLKKLNKFSTHTLNLMSNLQGVTTLHTTVRYCQKSAKECEREL